MTVTTTTSTPMPAHRAKAGSPQWVDVAQLKEELRIRDDLDDRVLQDKLDAAHAYILDRCDVPGVTPAASGELSEHGVPAGIVEATVLLTARYLARRNSPEGVLGFADFGPARIATIDRDVESLLARYRKPAFA